MKTARTLIPVLSIFVLVTQGCHRAEVDEVFPATTFLRTKWNPTHAYEIEYLDTNALSLALKKDGKTEVLETLRKEFLREWPYLDHTRFAPQYLNDLSHAMEQIEPGSARSLILELTSTERHELQNDYRSTWLEAHPQQKSQKTASSPKRISN